MLDNIISALSSIWGNKLRSLLTLLGVVIGVASVTTLIALGQGLKNDVAGLIQGFGTNVIVVIAGKIDTKATNQQVNPASLVAGDILTLSDVNAIKSLPEMEAVSPISLVSGTIKASGKESSSVVAGTYPNFLNALQVLKLDQGSMFDTDEASRVIVLGKSAADGLFPDGNVIGQKVTINATEFTVIGTLAKPSSTSSSVFGSSLDTFNLIPFGQATVMNKNQVKIMRILAKASDSANVKTKKTDIHNLLLSLRNGEENFTVLTQDDLLGLFDQFINLATSLVSAIATISLVVGGIGIMNIMLVTVTERTREIGLRIAVGATKGAILVQFLTEAVVITLMGGLIGLGISVVVARIISFKTPLHPVFSIQVVLATVAISVVIGVIFGIWPALRAAGKDPIEALRYE